PALRACRHHRTDPRFDEGTRHHRRGTGKRHRTLRHHHCRPVLLFAVSPVFAYHHRPSPDIIMRTNDNDRLFVSFAELKNYGVPFTRAHLTVLIRQGHFPKAYEISPQRIAWALDDVKQWVKSRPQHEPGHVHRKFVRVRLDD